MELNFVLDTNIIISLQKGVLADPLPAASYFVSVVTEMELLSFPGLTERQETAIQSLLKDVNVVGLDEALKRAAIQLRRLHRLRIPDAIVAGTAKILDAELFTNDERLLRLEEIRSRPLALRTPN